MTRIYKDGERFLKCVVCGKHIPARWERDRCYGHGGPVGHYVTGRNQHGVQVYGKCVRIAFGNVPVVERPCDYESHFIREVHAIHYRRGQ